ncbi:MAG: hypothetical protein EBR82_86940 [Caulobacteraceae bacterium]|nr:hypothetical protein [Caulobacteraceae bacterium]
MAGQHQQTPILLKMAPQQLERLELPLIPQQKILIHQQLLATLNIVHPQQIQTLDYQLEQLVKF